MQEQNREPKKPCRNHQWGEWQTWDTMTEFRVCTTCNKHETYHYIHTPRKLAFRFR
jgi:hypothetical protein